MARRTHRRRRGGADEEDDGAAADSESSSATSSGDDNVGTSGDVGVGDNGTAKYTVGSRRQVMYGTALRTGGGLTRADLMYNKHGRIVSKKRHGRGKALMKAHTHRRRH